MNWQENWIEIGAESKAGGQGKVTKVASKSNSSIIGALKIMIDDQIIDSKRRYRQLREVESLKTLDGFGVPKVLESYTTPDTTKTPYFIMEWLEGQDLYDYRMSHNLTIKDALEITRKLALILDRCHQKEIIHRDIKPQNIIIGNNNEPILVDFGMSWNGNSKTSKKYKTELGEELGNRFLRLPEFTAGSVDKHEKIADATYLVGILFFLITKLTPRQLKDSKNLMPQEKISNEINKTLSFDPLWHKVQRIFNIGFQQSDDLRFKSCISLIEYIDSCLEQKEFGELNSEKKLNETQKLLADIFNTEILIEKRKAIQNFGQLNRNLVKAIDQLLSPNGFVVSNSERATIDSHHIDIYITNIAFIEVRVVLIHHILIDDNSLVAGYNIKSTNNSKSTLSPISNPINYYKGYISDINTLIDNIEENKANFINKALTEYLRMSQG